MEYYLSQNSKIKKMNGVKTYNWGIPAFKSRSGFKTCPFAGKCAKGCYATMGAYAWSNVQDAYESRLILSKSDSFVQTLDTEIKKRKIQRVRVHDSGDFYSPKYRDKWFEIMRLNPETVFYAYTKAIPFFSGVDLPSNFTLIYSEGGKLDANIDTSQDRHSRVFLDEGSLIKAGYANASKDDQIALGTNPKIGLVFHGYKSKARTTDQNSIVK